MMWEIPSSGRVSRSGIRITLSGLGHPSFWRVLRRSLGKACLVALDFVNDFALEFVDTGEVTIRVRHGGEGPPVVLLHGHPRTHLTWWRVAPQLADAGFTRVFAEGGAEVAAALVAGDLVDEAIIIRAPLVVGAGGMPALGATPLAVMEDSSRFRLVDTVPLAADVMRTYWRAA